MSTSPDRPDANDNLRRTARQLGQAARGLRKQYSALVAARAEDEAQRARYQELFELAPDAYVVTDPDGRIREANRATAALPGRGRRALVGRRLTEFVADADRDAFERQLAALRQVRRVADLSLAVTPRAGPVVPTSVTGAAVQDEGGAIVALRWLIRDVSERRRAEDAQARLAAIVESSEDAIVAAAPDGRIESWNRGATHLYGYEAAEAIGMQVRRLYAPGSAREREQALARLLHGEGAQRRETQDVRKDGTIVDVSVIAAPILDADGRVVAIARIARDITESKRLEQRLRFFADRDALTGLYNRRHFLEEAARHAAYATRYAERHAALLVLDLDNLKHVNDALGHRAGDELIRAVARVLQERLRETDVLARIGGDEFVVLLPRADLEDARRVGETLRVAVAAHDAVTSGGPVHTTISVGVAPVGEPGVPHEQALVRADAALYEAKRTGRDRVVVAGAGLEAAKDAGRGWSQRLRAALAEGRFELYAQPVVELDTGRIARHELLLRLHDEQGRLVGPASFIDTAARLGLMGEIDRWVVAEGIRVAARDADRTRGYELNVSAPSIDDPELLAAIERELRVGGVDPGRLVFDVAEASATVDLDGAREFAERLRRLGSAVALDGFGSGLASFSYLSYLPMEYLKIDGRLVGRLATSRDDRVVVKAIVDVARGLGKRVVAEHVDSEEALALLREWGVEYGQGYGLGEPRPLEGGIARVA